MNPILATAITLIPAVQDFQPVPLPTEGGASVATIVGWILTGAAIACFLGLIFVVVRLATAPASQHGGHGVGKGLAYVLGAMMLLSTAGAITAAIIS